MNVRVAAVLGIAALMQLSGIPLLGISGEAATGDSWLFIAYMSADEPGSPLNWSADINEMESGLHGKNMTIIAMVDPPGTGDTTVYKIAHDPAGSDAIVSQVLAYSKLGVGGEAAMGENQTLIDFIDFSIEGYFDGGRVGVILWGHGNGWMGVCEDKGDYLEPKEIAKGLGAAAGQLGGPVDLLIFDACSMSSLETLSLLPGLAEYSVSSEIQVPDYGFPYDSVLAGISDNPSMSTLAAAEIFVDNYVQFSALVAGVTSQAAVVEIQALAEAMDDFERFCSDGMLFMPVARPVFSDVRNSSYEIGGGTSIDVMRYLTELANWPDAPKRLAVAGLDLLEGLRNCTPLDRVFIAPIDAGFLTPDHFQGFSLFFPPIGVQLDKYANASGLAADWSDFLSLLLANSSYARPDSGISPHMSDERYADGLADSISFTWDATAEIDEWSCDALVRGETEVGGQLNFSDSANESGNLDTLVPGYYDVCIYGTGSDGSYRYYAAFENITIMRRFSYDVHLPASVDGGLLEMVNLETGENSTMGVSGTSAAISFVVPSPYGEGDRILLTVVSGGTVVARGLVVLSGDEADVYLEEPAQPASMVSILLFMLAAGLIIFAFVKLNGVDRGSLRKLLARLRR